MEPANPALEGPVVRGGIAAAVDERPHAAESWRVRGAAVTAAALTVAFIVPLTRLVAHALGSDLLSYIPLVPLVSGYLLYTKPPVARARTSWLPALACAAVTIVLLAAQWSGTSVSLSTNDGLVLSTLAFVSALGAVGFLFLGTKWMAAASFPAAFLLLLVPLPDAAVNWLERMSVLGSAEVTAWFFSLSGVPFIREGTIFALPGITIEVARECSGIRSSWVLFITSLVATHLFLDSRWRKLALVAFIVPLAIVRNAFRILTIALLCVHVGPHMIDSPLHHRGGPIFFALSLIPFTAVLLWLRRTDGKPRRPS